MDELDDGRELVPCGALRAEGVGGKQHQRGPQALAAAAHDVSGDGADEHHVGGKPPVDDFVDALEVLGDGIPDRFQARRYMGMTLGQVFDLTRDFGYYIGLGREGEIR